MTKSGKHCGKRRNCTFCAHKFELGLALKAFNCVTKFEKKKRFTFVTVIARKRSVTDRQTNRN